MRPLILLLPVAILVGSCGPKTEVADRPTGLGFNKAFMDTTVRPQDDYFRYANGAWLKTAEIPEDRPYTASFTELREASQEQLRAVIEFAAESEFRPEGSDAQKIGDVYLSYMDTVRIESLGLTPIEDELKQIEDISSQEDLIRFIGRSERTGITDPFAVIVNQDFKRPTEYMLYFAQSGIGLPDRDYYFEEQFKKERDAYLKHIERMFELADMAEPAEQAQRVYDLENGLAQSHWSKAKSRDRNATYNKYSVDGVKALMPHFDWDLYLEEIQAAGQDTVVIRQTDYFEALDKAFAEVPLEDWKSYLTFRVLSSAAPRLPQEFVNENFDFFGKTLNGQPVNQPRWKRAVTATDGAVGELVGKLYVEKYFPEESKARMEDLIANLSSAFGDAIDELEWMSDSTKAEARDKLSKFTAKIGYPDEWRDYSDLEIQPDDLYGNLRRASATAHARDMAKLGNPVDRGEWFATPQTVNAFYNPPMNSITFPAAILQPPFFDSSADDAFNYGAIGQAIGHEFSHGFDDQGRKSDGDGVLRDWWTETDAAEYEKRAKGLVDQFSAFSPLEGIYVNGELTLGENIGDLAGLTMAYRAYQISLGGKEAPVIDGFTGDERFFMGSAQVWRSKFRDEFLKRIIVSDPHAPSEYRANGILANMPEFVETYGVKEGDGMWIAPEDRVKIW